MLITLREDEYDGWLHALLGDSDFGQFVEALAASIQYGEHAVCAKPALLDRLSNWPGISRGQKAALDQMARDVSSRALPFDAVTDSLVITGPGGATPDPPGVRWHRRDWRWLQHHGRLAVSCLAAEHINDAKWYQMLAVAWGVHLRPSCARAGQEVRFNPRGLGGSAAADELARAAENGDPILCILDSDRDCPGASEGSTARRALEWLKLSSEVMVHVEILDARDIENILPADLVQEVTPRGVGWVAPMVRRGFFACP
jgi:hypothetical protein